MYELRVAGTDAVAIDGGIGDFNGRVALLFVRAGQKHLLCPSCIEVVWEKLYAQSPDFSENLGSLEGRVGVDILEDAGDACRSRTRRMCFQVVTDAVNTFHVGGIVIGTHAVAYDINLLCVFEVDVVVIIHRRPLAVVDDDLVELFFCDRFFQLFVDFYGIVCGKQQDVRVFVF